MADDKEKQDQESLKAIQAQNETAKELLSTYEKLKKTKGSLKADDQAILDLSKQLVQSSKTLETSIQQRNDKSSTAKQLSQTLNQLEKEYKNNVRNSTDTVDKLNKQKTAALNFYLEAGRKEKSIQQTLTEELRAQDEILDEIDRLKRSGGTAQQLADERQKLQLVKQSIKDVEKTLEKTTKTKEEQKNIFKQLNEAKKAHEETIKQQEQELELAKEELKVKQKQELLQKAIKNGQSALNTLGLEQLTQAFTLSGLFKMMVEGAFKVDKQVTQLSKSLGVSKEYTEKMRNGMFAYAQASGDSFLNTERLYKAQQGLTEQLGIAVDFGHEEQETFARLTEITGLTADEAGKLAQNSAAAGISTKAYLADIRNAAFQAQLATNTHISDKKLLQDISKLSAGILVKFQGNPKAIAEAVVQANKLGLNLDKVDKIGDSLLDWESSINNELEAELITGKKLNLERAREAALTGDQATLMQEIASQAGSLEEFSHMNVIAQQSLAKAFGMNREEMSDMLMKQEAINKYGDKAADLNKEQLEYMEKNGLSADQMQEKLQNQRDTQEKFNDAMLKLQDIVSQLVAGPFGKLLEIIGAILGNTYALSAIMAVYIGKQIYLLTLKTAELLLSKKNAKTNAVDGAIEAGKSAAKIPIIGAVAGIAAAALAFATFSSLLSKGDDVVSTGYGKRMLLDKGSITAFNNQDTILAGTNLGGGVKKQQPTSSPGMAAMGAMVGAIDKLAAASNRPAVAYINGRDAFADDMGRNNSLGTSQMQNSYKLA
jgi:hypothetical protein